MSFSENGLTLHWLIMHWFIIIQIIPIWMAINGLSSHPYGMPAHLPGSSTFPTCRGTGSKLCWKIRSERQVLQAIGKLYMVQGLVETVSKSQVFKASVGAIPTKCCCFNWSWVSENGVYHQHRFLSRENEQWIWGCTKERGTARQRNALQTPVELTAEPAVWLPKHLRKQLKLSFCGIQKTHFTEIEKTVAEQILGNRKLFRPDRLVQSNRSSLVRPHQNVL